MIERFWNWIDNRAVAHRLVLIYTLWLTTTEMWHAWQFAKASTFDGVGTAAVIAAVLVPLGAVQTFAFQMYSKRRSGT